MSSQDCTWFYYWCSHNLQVASGGCLGLQLKRPYLFIVALSRRLFNLLWLLPEAFWGSRSSVLILSRHPPALELRVAVISQCTLLWVVSWWDDCGLKSLVSPAGVGLHCRKWRWDLEPKVVEFLWRFICLLYSHKKPTALIPAFNITATPFLTFKHLFYQKSVIL